MCNERFNIVHCPILERRRRERMIRLVCAGGHVLDALFNDAKALPHFFDADKGPIVTVAMNARRDIEFEMLVTGIWLLFPEIPVHAARSKIWTGYAPLDRLFGSECANAHGPRLENAIAENRTVVFREPRGQILDECAYQVVPSLREILRNAADAKPVRVHPRPADCFDDFERTLTVVEGVEDGRHLPDILRVGSVPDKMAD